MKPERILLALALLAVTAAVVAKSIDSPRYDIPEDAVVRFSAPLATTHAGSADAHASERTDESIGPVSVEELLESPASRELRLAFFDTVSRANLDVKLWDDPDVRRMYANSREIAKAIDLLQKHRTMQAEEGPACPTLESLIRSECPEAIPSSDLRTWELVALFDGFESPVLSHGDDVDNYPQEQGDAQDALQKRLIEIDEFVAHVRPTSTEGNSADR